MDSPDPAALNALFAAGEYKACKKGYAALLTACDLGGEPDGDHPLAREAAAAFTNVAACNVMLNKVRAGGSWDCGLRGGHCARRPPLPAHVEVVSPYDGRCWVGVGVG
jgi:hypothetical protein